MNNYFELKIATSLSATYFIAVIFKWIAKQIEKNIEDGLKLTTDYKALINQYSGNINKMFKIRSDILSVNINAGNDYLNSNYDEEFEMYPIVLEYFNDKRLEIFISDNPKKKYELPDIIKNNYLDLFNVHKHSLVFNAVNIRLDDLKISENTLELITSRTSYFNGLVTNRAMDHVFSPNLSIRKLFEYNNKISTLNESLMSNHIGINGSIITSDNKVIFVRRFKNVSIAKNVVGCSVGASLKAKYCLDNYGNFTLKGLENAIKSEINDELGINEDKYEFSFDNNFIGIYRDLVEGGKPQILIAVKVNSSSSEIEQDYKKKAKSSKDVKGLIIDGKKLLFINQDAIRVSKTNIYDSVNSKKYETIPSVSASTALAIKWFAKYYK